MAENRLGAALLSWYRKSRRDLPWRRRGDAYAIWVSEIMLQQTRVEVVEPYYRRFLERFPSVEALAAADLETVSSAWSGLGYYRRARQMHRAAREIVAAGGFPTTVDGLRRLPGIGDYTAAAVASIAFGVAAPALDGNVLRVLARLEACAEDPRRAAVRRRLRRRAEALLDRRRPGDSNQALMELGATVCLPRAPRCGSCPLSDGCRAAAEGRPELYPPPRSRRRSVRVRWRAVVVTAGGRILLVRRPEGSDLLAGTWELPWVEWGPVREAAARLADRYGGRWRVGPAHGRVRHQITWRNLEVEVREGVLEEGSLASGEADAGWFHPAELERLPLSSLVAKALSRAGLGEPGLLTDSRYEPP